MNVFSGLRRRAASGEGKSAHPEDVEKMAQPPSVSRLGTLSPGCTKTLKGLSVAVVGGGFAGLMAARTLCQHGVKVTVFEARAQVGGRVLSDSSFSAGRVIEAGAELVGSIHTRWCELASNYGLSLISRMDAELYRGHGLHARLKLDKALTMDEMRALAEQMETRVLRPIAEMAASINDATQPWLQPELEKFDQMSVADALTRVLEIPKREQRLWKAMEMLLVNNNVAPLEQLNFLGLLCLVKGGQAGTIDARDALMGYWDELEIYRCADGCQKLALEIAKDIQKNHACKILLRQAVTRIDLEKPSGGKAVSITFRAVSRDRDRKPQLRVEGFDHVVFTIPPTVWADVTITPVHPKEPGQVGLMKTGPAIKFFSDVAERFWIRNMSAPYGGSLALGQVWEGTENQTRVGRQGIVLSVFSGGKSTMPTVGALKRELIELYPDYPRFLRKELLVDWPRQPFIKTGYASPGIGQIFTVGKMLHRSFGGRMFFAGEHTQMSHFGYMEGALRSGERAAEHLIRRACNLLAPQRVKPCLDQPVRRRWNMKMS